MNLKSLFFEDDRKKEPITLKQDSPPVKAEVVGGTYKAVVQNPAPVAAAPVQSGTDYTQQLRETVRGAVEKGFSYITFADALTEMQSMPLNDQQKFQIAFAPYKASGYSVTQLLNSANQCIAALQEDDHAFSAALSNSNTEGVEAKKQEVEKLTKRNEEILKEMTDNNVKIQQLNAEMNTNQSKLQVEQQSFNYSLNLVRTEVENNITKIKQYLNVNTTNAS